MDPMYPCTDRAYILKSTRRSTRLLEVLLVVVARLNKLFQWCRPTMQVPIWACHCTYVRGNLGDLHLTKLCTVHGDPVHQLLAGIVAVLYPAALSMVEVHACDAVHRLERRRDGGHQGAEGHGCNSEISSTGTRSWLKEIRKRRILETDRVLQPPEDGGQTP